MGFSPELYPMNDLFSKQSKLYARYRPVYPRELFDHILSLTGKRSTAWDCGTGNGQTASVLANYFETVIATDISQQQIDNAAKAGNIVYQLEPAEKTSIGDNSIDLITVSQALHWFRFDEFYKEVNRVAKPGAIFAAWTYNLLSISPEIDRIIHHYHYGLLDKYWPVERHYVDNGYADIPFPYEEIKSPAFLIEVNWSAEELEGYFNTWSALHKFFAEKGYNPVGDMMRDIRAVWGETPIRRISFPVTVKAAIVKS